MKGPTPARLLAPLALVLAAIALFVVLGSGGGDDPAPSAGEATPTATATATATASSRRRRRDDEDTKTYTVKSGDSPSTIAAAEGISVDELLKANPEIDPTALSVGDELEVPEG